MSEMSKVEIIESINESLQQPAMGIDETVEELKAMGIRDISEAQMGDIMAEAMKNVQIQRTLADITRGSHDRKSAIDYLEHHIKFLVSLSPGKTERDIAKMIVGDLEHAKAILKTTAKMEVADDVLKKHLKTIRKKFKIQ